ncbi:MAG: hypothetical protein QUS14_04090 [Pyrinomonadaceae bacterium]|jgi:hypothetical protein|nr:hypothetical protein [Pyrinomonadaceae bacterium]
MKILFGLVLSLLFAFTAFPQTAAPTVFNDPQGVFSITVPATWRVKKTFNEGLRFEASRGADLAFEYIAIAVNTLPADTKLTPTAYANVFLQGKPEYWQTLADAAYPGGKLISKGAAKVNQQDAIFIIAEGTVEFNNLKSTERTYSVQTLVQNEVIGISFSAPANRMQALLPEYEKIVASIVLKPRK